MAEFWLSLIRSTKKKKNKNWKFDSSDSSPAWYLRLISTLAYHLQESSKEYERSAVRKCVGGFATGQEQGGGRWWIENREGGETERVEKGFRWWGACRGAVRSDETDEDGG